MLSGNFFGYPAMLSLPFHVNAHDDLVVAVALANKMARTAWAVLARGENYRAPALMPAA